MAYDVWPAWTKSNQRNLPRYVNAALARDAMPAGFFSLEPADSFHDLLTKNKLPEVAEKLYDKLCGLGVEYDLEPLRLEDPAGAKQNIRPPANVIQGGSGTCLDLALLFAGLCLEKRLLPLVILLGGAGEIANHALVAIDRKYTADQWAEPRGLIDAYREGVIQGKSAAAFIQQCIDDGKWLAVQCTGFAAARTHGSGNRRLSFAEACAAGKKEIETRDLIVALDIATLQAKGETPYEAKEAPKRDPNDKSGETAALTFAQRAGLTEALLKCPTLQARRDELLDQMRPAVKLAVPRQKDSRSDVLNIVTTSANYPGGLEELLQLVGWFEGGSIPWQHVEKYVHSELKPFGIRLQPDG